MRRLLTALLLLLLSACATTPGGDARTVILVSLDGFRPTDLEKGFSPHLDAIARGGVRAEYMRPSYPSLTFPNHYTLVTGLRPDRHGVIHNTMRDPALGSFALGKPAALEDPRWWGGEPLWATAEKAGMRTATMFWPGSSTPIGGLRPTEWMTYDETFKAEQRVERVLEWLARPGAERPRFVTLYLEHVDEASHDHGPNAPETMQAVREVDGHIGRLRRGIESLGLADRVDLVVVSDHGLAEVAPSNRVALEDMVAPELAEWITDGQTVGFVPRAGHEDAARKALIGRHAHYSCWTRETLPAGWHYGRHPRVPAIVCQMDEGWDAASRKRIASSPRTHVRGSHGYDPTLPSMRALFIADGPSFRDGATLPPFDNVDVYPLLSRLLGLKPLDNDGDLRTLQPALRGGR